MSAEAIFLFNADDFAAGYGGGSTNAPIVNSIDGMWFDSLPVQVH